MPKMSIVIPVYYNAENLPPLYADIKEKILDKVDFPVEIVMVDDGSGDEGEDAGLQGEEGGRELELDLAAVMTIAPSSVSAADAVWQSSNAAFVVTNGKVTCNTAYGSLTNKTASITCTFPCGTKTVFNVTLIPSGATFSIMTPSSGL